MSNTKKIADRIMELRLFLTRESLLTNEEYKSLVLQLNESIKKDEKRVVVEQVEQVERINRRSIM